MHRIHLDDKYTPILIDRSNVKKMHHIFHNFRKRKFCCWFVALSQFSHSSSFGNFILSRYLVLNIFLHMVQKTTLQGIDPIKSYLKIFYKLKMAKRNSVLSHILVYNFGILLSILFSLQT